MEMSTEVSAILQVILINVVLSGDNAIVVGMAAAGAPAALRKRVIFYGIAGAVVLRIVLSLLAVKFLGIVGLLFAGGLLLLWVCWKLYREIQNSAAEHAGAEALGGDMETAIKSTKTLGDAMWQIIVADFSMSLDNVLAIAGAARDEPTYVLIGGLALSIVLMGIAATFIAKLLDRYRWLAWVGLLVILYVAGKMIWDGAWEIEEAVVALHWPATVLSPFWT